MTLTILSNLLPAASRAHSRSAVKGCIWLISANLRTRLLLFLGLGLLNIWPSAFQTLAQTSEAR
jgi:hypothetical protein